MSQQRHPVAHRETRDRAGVGAAGRRTLRMGMAAFIRVGELEGKGEE